MALDFLERGVNRVGKKKYLEGLCERSRTCSCCFIEMNEWLSAIE